MMHSIGTYMQKEEEEVRASSRYSSEKVFELREASLRLLLLYPEFQYLGPVGQGFERQNEVPSRLPSSTPRS